MSEQKPEEKKLLQKKLLQVNNYGILHEIYCGGYNKAQPKISYDIPTLDYGCGNTNPLEHNSFLLDHPIIIATNNHAYDLLNKAKGENGKFVARLYEDETKSIKVSITDLEFIKKIGTEWMQNHLNEISEKEFRFFMRCICKREIMLEEFANTHTDQETEALGIKIRK